MALTDEILKEYRLLYRLYIAVITGRKGEISKAKKDLDKYYTKKSRK